ncbi:MAG: ABC transporter ATP-binding protein [Cardiobacteriaceae bacterium]|nr:ABC transporter ATP-binding protein [Cardiobacteriaceae bacterium]
MIEVRDLYKTFNPQTPLENPVLRGLSLSLEQGEFVTVIGSNGAGKSTFLNALAGDVIPDSGQILVGGREITHLSTYQRAAWISRVFQNPLLGTCADLSIEENLALAIKRGRERYLSWAVKGSYQKRFADLLAPLGLGLEHRLRDKMGLLSGGQRQAVSLLMASLTNSEVLLLDEHTAALDPKTAHFVLEITKRIVEEQKLTTLMVTHSMRQALDYGTRTVMLHQGKVVFDLRGEERAKANIGDLLRLFEREQGESLSDDRLLME